MFALGNSTTTERKNTSPRPSALLDARLNTICWSSETWRTSPVAVREKIGTVAPSGAGPTTVVSLIEGEPPLGSTPDERPPGPARRASRGEEGALSECSATSTLPRRASLLYGQDYRTGAIGRIQAPLVTRIRRRRGRSRTGPARGSIRRPVPADRSSRAPSRRSGAEALPGPAGPRAAPQPGRPGGSPRA